MPEIAKVYVELLEEGTDTFRPTFAEELVDGTYKLLPTSDYDPENEVWAFLPYSIVRCKSGRDEKGNDLLFVCEQVK